MPTPCTYTFLLGLLFAGSATALYFYIVSKVRSAGDDVSRMITPWSLRALTVRYKSLAEERGWPQWPVRVMWFSMFLIAVVALIDALMCRTA
jgi:hypothetical protein